MDERDGYAVLNRRELEFARKYIATGNAMGSAEWAGYANPEKASRQLLKHPEVKAVIAKADSAIVGRHKATKGQIVTAMANVIHVSVKSVVDPTYSRVLPVADIDQDVMAAIDKIDTYPNGSIRRIVFTDKSKQIADLSKMLGLSTAHRCAVNRKKERRPIIVKVLGVDDQ